MLRGLFGTSCLVVVGGCVALNSGFDPSSDGTGGTEASDTGQRTAGESDSGPSAGGSSAVTTVTPDDSGGGTTTDPTHSSGNSASDPGDSSGTSGGDSDSSEGDSSEGDSGASGDMPCGPPAGGPVDQDAFLLECPDGCANQNYGQTEQGSLADGEVTGALLLALPVSDVEDADRIEVTLRFVAGGSLPSMGFSIEAYAVGPICDWAEGPHQGAALDDGQPGVTAAYCNGTPGGLLQWTPGIGETVWENLDPEWTSDEVSYGGDEVQGGEPFVETFVLQRRVPGGAPQALLISSDAPGYELLSVFTSESANAPFVEVSPACR